MNDPSPESLAQRCAEAMYARDRAAQHLGITVDECGPGRSLLRMVVGEEMLNGHAICHGGIIFALADTAFAYACNSEGEVNVAQGCSIDFVSSAQLGDVLLASAERRFQAGRTGMYDVQVSRQDGSIVAYFRGRSYRVRGDVLTGPGTLEK